MLEKSKEAPASPASVHVDLKISSPTSTTMNNQKSLYRAEEISTNHNVNREFEISDLFLSLSRLYTGRFIYESRSCAGWLAVDDAYGTTFDFIFRSRDISEIVTIVIEKRGGFCFSSRGGGDISLRDINRDQGGGFYFH
ncbi:hypothetical protein L6452_16127 [Arctium lappa]|uniref:Uncharacterized protein n=1 Tax=Arctium lappa TaxID=4217 RepID=A0ACB9BZS1_ARCLA|nr:hypothetical protein L6452_16127 [Arctium lappa]